MELVVTTLPTTTRPAPAGSASDYAVGVYISRPIELTAVPGQEQMAGLQHRKEQPGEASRQKQQSKVMAELAFGSAPLTLLAKAAGALSHPTQPRTDRPFRWSDTGQAGLVSLEQRYSRPV